MMLYILLYDCIFLIKMQYLYIYEVCANIKNALLLFFKEWPFFKWKGMPLQGFKKASVSLLCLYIWDDYAVSVIYFYTCSWVNPH